MNHWLQQATAHLAPTQAKPPRPPKKDRQLPIRHYGKAKDRVRELVQLQPVGVWFNAAEVWDETICVVDYVRKLLKGMAERGELVSEFRAETSKHTGYPDQRHNKWMFKREK